MSRTGFLPRKKVPLVFFHHYVYKTFNFSLLRWKLTPLIQLVGSQPFLNSSMRITSQPSAPKVLFQRGQFLESSGVQRI